MKYIFESMSEEEIVSKFPDKVKEIEELIQKKLGKKVDIESSKPSQNKEVDKEENKEEEKIEEGAGVSTLTLLFIPLVLEASGNLINLIKAKTGIGLTKEQWKSYKLYNKVISAYKTLLDRDFCDFTWSGKTTRYTYKNWKELGKKAAEIEKSEIGVSDSKLSQSDKKVEESRLLKTYESFIKYIKEEAEEGSDKDAVKHEIERLKSVRNELFGSKIGEKIIEAGHKLHSAYTYPIRLLLKGLSLIPGNTKLQNYIRDKNNRKIVANVVYGAYMAYLAGGHILHGMEHLEGLKTAKPLIFDAIKGGRSISDVIKGVLSSLTGEVVH